MRFTAPSFLALAAAASAQDAATLTQSLQSALSERSDVSLFNAMLVQFPTLIDDVVSNKSSVTANGVTVLVPNDDAITAYLQESGLEPADLAESLIRTTFSYHIMVSALREVNFTMPNGLTIPTLLDGLDEDGTSFNLRAPAPQLQEAFGEEATGQVLFAKLDSASNKVRIKTRQDDDGLSLLLRAGRAQDVEMEVVDGEWAGGVYQIVKSVLTPPSTCSNTIRGLSDTLTSLDFALNKTDLWSTLDASPNVTCLAPSDDAFMTAGNPEDSLSQEALTTALLDHTLHGPTYSDLLVDGQKLLTVSNKTVTVTLNDTGLFFNDAMVIQQNVLTNNGLVHILDRVMTVEDSSEQPTNGSDTTDGSDSTDGSESTDTEGGNAAGITTANVALMGVAGMLAAVLLV